MADRDLDLRLIIRADGSLAIRNLNQVGEALDNVGENAERAGRQTRDMGNQVNQSGGLIGNARGILREFAIGVASAFSVKALFDFGAHVLRVNREMEDLRATLKSVTGSSEAAIDAFDQIQDFARETPFQIQELTQTFIKLKSFGIEPTNQVMLAITNQASKLGASTETLNGITLALGQAWAKGKLQGEEILQLVERGVPVYEILAQATGKNSAELQKMAEKGELGRAVIQQLIVKMGELASGANAEAINTISGSVSNLSDAWTRFEDNLLDSDAENAIKRFTTNAASNINALADALELLDAKFNGASTPRLQARLNLENINDLYEQIEKQKRKIAAIKDNGSIGSLIDDLAGTDLALEQNRLDAMYKELSEKITVRSLLLDEARGKAARRSAEADNKLKAALSQATTASDGSSKTRDDAKQQAAAEVQIQLDKIARIEQIAAAEFQNDIARAEAQAREKLARAKGDKQAELAIEQELAEAKAAIERNQLEASRSFAEERLRAQLAGKQQELALTKDRGEQAKIQADIVKLEEQIKTARDVSGLAAQKLAIDETAAAAQRAQAQQDLVDQVILKYDLLAARMKEFDADAAIISNSNLSENRKAEILALIAKRYGEAGKAADEFGRQADQFAEQAARNIQDSFANFLFNPFQNGLKGMLLGFVDTIRKIIAEALAADIAHALGFGGKDNKGGNSEALLDGFTGLIGGADDLAQVTANEAAKTAAVTAGEAARTAAVTSGAAAKTAAVAGGQAAQTSAVVVGETTRQATETAGQSKSLALTITTAAKKIHAHAASAAAGAYEAMASIPYVGPVLGGIAAAVTYAAVMAFGALTGGAAFAAGGRVDGTPGGRMRGPGSGTSDDIPAWVSNNEHIIKEDSVRKLDAKYGSAFLDFLNQYGEIPQGAKALAIPALKIPTVKFSAGGRVNASAANGRGGATNVDARSRIDFTAVNVIDPALVHDAMASAGGTRVLLNVITNNPRAFKQALEL
jgi:tape measure domain-containing protein